MRIFFIVPLVLMALAACAPTALEVTPVPRGHEALVLRGQAIAEHVCRTCHAIGRSDQSRNAEAPALRSLSQRYPVNALEEAFAEGILVGHPAMPEFQFSPDDIDVIVAYLETIQERRGG